MMDFSVNNYDDPFRSELDFDLHYKLDVFHDETNNQNYYLYLVKTGDLQVWSLHIPSFPRNSSSKFQRPYFRLCRCTLLTMLSGLVMLKKNPARRYALEFAKNKKFVNSEFGAYLG